LGNFDYTSGGHLILWECGIVLEFPPGWTILIPSACIAHSNANIGKGEKRYSFTQYTAGAVFQHLEQNFMTKTKFWTSLSVDEQVEEAEKSKNRLQWGLSLFSTYSKAPS
jgi:hypothetical protein